MLECNVWVKSIEKKTWKVKCKEIMGMESEFKMEWGRI